MKHETFNRDTFISIWVCVFIRYTNQLFTCAYMSTVCVCLCIILKILSKIDLSKMHNTPLSVDKDQSILEIGYGTILNAKWQMVWSGYMRKRHRERKKAIEWIREPIILKCSISFKVILKKYTNEHSIALNFFSSHMCV